MAITHRRAIFLNRANEILKDHLMASKVTDHRRRRVLLVERRRGRFDPCGWILEVNGDDAILLKNYCSFRAGDLNTPRISRKGGRRCLQQSEGTIRKLEEGQGRVLTFDLVQCR